MNLGDMSGLNRAASDFIRVQSDKARQTSESERTLIQLGVLADANLASAFHARLSKRIAAFENALDQTQDVGVQLVSFGQSITFHVTNVGYYNPSLILFQGNLDNGNPVELIQHVSQLSFLLMALKRPDPNQPRRKIGFGMQGDASESSNGPDTAAR